MATQYASGKYAIAECDRCGQRYKLKELKKEIIKTKLYQIKVCPSCWTPDHPQLQLGMYPVEDPQAIRDPRPDTNTWYASGTTGLQTSPTTGTGIDQEGYPGEGMLTIQWNWNPIGGPSANDDGLTPNYLSCVSVVGTVTVSVT